MSLLQEAQTRGHDWISTLVQHVSDLVVVVDIHGTVIYANAAAARLYGVPVEEAIGTNVFQYIHPDDRERVFRSYTELLGRPGATVVDTVRVMSRSSGESRILEIVRTNLLHLPEIAGIVVNGRDVTERNNYINRLQVTLDAITLAIANTIDIKDPYTAGHQREVAYLAEAIARELAMSDDEVKGIEVASTLHDIGKIALPAEVLNRPGKLSSPEFEMIKRHSQTGHDIVADVPFPWPVAEMILQHHERLDGSGYPNGLSGGEILPGSRIIAVADVISAMSGHRPYRPARGIKAALVEVESERGRLYDPDAVDASLRLFRDRSFSLEGSLFS